MNKVVLIGAGNMATQLCRSFYAEGHPIHQVYNRTENHAQHLAPYINGEIITSIETIDPDADLYIISVSDRAIKTLANTIIPNITNPNSIIVHTAGNTSIKALSNAASQRVGVFYPLQSVRKEREVSLKNVPILISSDDDEVLQELKYYAQILSEKIYISSDEERSKLHLPAVMVNNLVNHIYSLAKEYCEQEKLPFEYLYALMGETTQRILSGADPEDVQTGPAVRKDTRTIQRHLAQLSAYPDTQEMYDLLSKQILEKSKI